MGSGRPCTVRITANVNDAEDQVLSQDNNPDYKLVLLLKEDNMNIHCDFFVNSEPYDAVFC